jgi:hypothetical protein
MRSVDAVLQRAHVLRRRAAVLEFRLRRFLATLKA